MYFVTIDLELCEGCGDCAEICPYELLEVRDVDGRKRAVYVGDPEDCLGCESCLSACGNVGITIEEY
jgi:NAD-dependent dihydropyrimidine dehydrogenase PreA subunit